MSEGNDGENNKTPQDDNPQNPAFTREDYEKQKAHIHALNEENKKHREANEALKERLGLLDQRLEKIGSAFGGEGDKKPTPEEVISMQGEQIRQLQAREELRQWHAEVSEIADSMGIPREKHKIFRLLVEDKTNDLPEGGELSEEEVTEIYNEVMGTVAGGSKNNSSTTGGGGTPPADDPEDQTTFDEFLAMNIIQKGDYRVRNPNQYDVYFRKAVQEKRL